MQNITVEINHIDNHQYVLIKDDGKGIPKEEIDDVVSIGKRRNYKPEDSDISELDSRLLGYHRRITLLFSRRKVREYEYEESLSIG